MDILEEDKLLMGELRSLERSFKAAQRTMRQIKSQITEVRKNIGYGDYLNGGELVYEFKKEVRTIQQQIPYSLIYPPSSTKIDTNNKNVVQHLRDGNFVNKDSIWAEPFYFEVDEDDDPDERIEKHNCLYAFLYPAPIDPTHEYFEQSLRSFPNEYSIPFLECLMCFPQHMIIKQSVFWNCMLALSESSSRLEDNPQVSEAEQYLEEHGFFRTVCKSTSLSLPGYWIPPIPYGFLKHYFQSRSSTTKESIYFSPCPSKEPRVIYSGDDSITENVTSVKALLLGKWRRQLPDSQHTEVEDPGLFYKGLEKLTEVRYISLRGISMIPKLPQFITKLKKLKVLDCKDCHDLEVIPDNINKLWRTLTRLDISECLFLEHMPLAISDLIHLEVLKGFHVGEPSQKRKSCTLQNLTKLSKLEKLQIITSVKEFPSTGHLTDLQKFESLAKLTITWRLSQTRDDKSISSSDTTARGSLAPEDSTGCGGDQQQLSLYLDKLDLRCVPNTVTRDWLNPVVFEGLQKLYIRGGKFFDLGQRLEGEPEEENTSVIAEEKQWTVRALRLKYLSELRIDRIEVASLFPEIYVMEVQECPKFTTSGFSNDGIFWFSYVENQ